MAEKQVVAKSSVDSGVKESGYVPVLGGMPSSKSVDEIEKANSPKSAPGSVRA